MGLIVSGMLDKDQGDFIADDLSTGETVVEPFPRQELAATNSLSHTVSVDSPIWKEWRDIVESKNVTQTIKHLTRRSSNFKECLDSGKVNKPES